MNIQTQMFVDKLHDLKTKLQLHQNKVGYDICTETYIQMAGKLLDWFQFNGSLNTGAPISHESSKQISLCIAEIEQYIREL
jgi:hypothetical protein